MHAVLGKRLNSIPSEVSDTRSVAIGTYHGLDFGLVIHKHGMPEVYLQGELVRHDTVARDAGPRAVLNALSQVIDSYPMQAAKARQELGIAQGQLRDYEARISKPFAHDAYPEELTGLRDQLKAGLAEKKEEGAPEAAEVAEKIKALRATNTIEAAPERMKAVRKATAEVPARIKRQAAEEPQVVEELAALPPAEEPTPIIVPIQVAAARSTKPEWRAREMRRTGERNR
jgi:hypothetical protein